MKRIIIYTNKDKSNQRKVDINYTDFKMLKSNLLNINEYKMILYLSI